MPANGARLRSGELTAVINPATGDTIAQTPMGGAAEVNAAVEAASAAYPEWRRTPPQDRIQYLFQAEDACSKRTTTRSPAASPPRTARRSPKPAREVLRSVENVEVACGIPTLMQGYNLEDVARGIDEIMIRQPLGVVAAITPFNFPGDGSDVVPALRHRLRQHLHPETRPSACRSA